MASLGVVVIILGCVAYQYFKGTFIKAVATIIVAICASVVAFSYFEPLANVFISRSDNSRFLSIAPWAQPLCFMLLFIVTFAILQTAAAQLSRQPVDLGFLPERIGRSVCGVVLGLLTSGLLLTALQMGPLSIAYPYQRFDLVKLEPDNPDGVLLNADGFATGLFSIISKGSLSGKRSFAAVHPDYLDQLFLNRMISDISIITSSYPAIEVQKLAVWPAPEAIKKRVDFFVEELNRRGRVVDEPTGKSVPMPGWPKGAYDPTIVRVVMRRSALKTAQKINAGTFTHPQLRLICKRKGSGEDRLAGNGINVYPIGHLKAADDIQVSPGMKIERDDFAQDTSKKPIDFVFCVPNGFEPVLVQFKLNSIAEIPPSAIVPLDKAPQEAAVFISRPEETQKEAEQTGRPSDQSRRPRPAPDRRGLSNTTRTITGIDLDE